MRWLVAAIPNPDRQAVVFEFLEAVLFPIIYGLHRGFVRADRQVSIKGKLFQFRPHVMKKILLGVTGVRPEMGRGKMPQPFVTDPAAREIEFAQCAFDPDVHGKRAVKTKGEEQDAIGNFTPDATQGHQFPARFRQGQMPQPLQI